MNFIVVGVICGALPVWLAAQSPLPKTVQSSSAPCSPNIVNNSSAPITIKIDGSCSASDKNLIQQLERMLRPFKMQAQAIENLNRLLATGGELAMKVQDIEDRIRKYNELAERMQSQSGEDGLSRAAADASKQGDLASAEAILKGLIAKEELQVERAARHHFDLGTAYTLEFNDLALAEFQKAYEYRPGDFEYAATYASSLGCDKAVPIFLKAIENGLPYAQKSRKVADTLAKIFAIMSVNLLLCHGQQEAEEMLNRDLNAAKLDPFAGDAKAWFLMVLSSAELWRFDNSNACSHAKEAAQAAFSVEMKEAADDQAKRYCSPQ